MDIQGLMTGVADFIVNSVVGVLLFVAFCSFLVNAFRYFIMQSTTEEGREKAKRFMLWSILGFVTIISIQGFIIFIRDGLSLGNSPVTPDYMENRPSSSSGTGTSSATNPTPPPTNTGAKCMKDGEEIPLEGCVAAGGVLQWPSSNGTGTAKCMKNGAEIPLEGCISAGGVLAW